MWILENEGDAFNGELHFHSLSICSVSITNIHEGKKLWLRPGKKYLFGRTQIDGMPITSRD